MSPGSEQGSGCQAVVETQEKWKNKCDFVISLVGFAVALGNIVRFPYLCLRNGGGAFLIPYYFFLIVCGIPLFYLECVIGQFSGFDALSVWKICPIFRGVGCGQVLVNAIILVYYNVILAWSLYFLGMSFASSVPWASCDNPWNSPSCTLEAGKNLTSTNISSEAYFRSTNVTVNFLKPRSPTEEFWENNVLGLSSGIDEIGTISWKLFICLAVAWLMCFLCVFKGIKWSGKVVYVTATAPFLFLTAILIRSVTLPGAREGLLYFVTPDFKRLAVLKTWVEAAIQIFYTLGAAWGPIVGMACHNKFDHNIFRDTMIVCWTCCGSSFFGGLVVFSVLGYLSHEVGLPIEDVVTSGPGLAFVTYPAALAKIPLAPLWSVCFFLVLIMVGLDSVFVTFEVVISSCLGHNLKTLKRYRVPITAAATMVYCCTGLIFITKGGMYYFQVFDWYLATFSVMIFGIFECIVVSWVYDIVWMLPSGFSRLYYDMEMMFGYRPSSVWKLLWGFIIPSLLGFMVVYNAVTLTTPSYGDYHYPNWAVAFGFVVAFSTIIPIPIWLIYDVSKANGPFLKRIRNLLKPDVTWRPSQEPYRSMYKYGLTEKPCEMETLKPV